MGPRLGQCAGNGRREQTLRVTAVSGPPRPQRGAASFVAQLRDTKENSDVLVSLILTKDMLLVAGKPRRGPGRGRLAGTGRGGAGRVETRDFSGPMPIGSALKPCSADIAAGPQSQIWRAEAGAQPEAEWVGALSPCSACV